MHHPTSIQRVRSNELTAGYCPLDHRWAPIKIHSHSSGKERIVCAECFTPIVGLRSSLTEQERKTACQTAILPFGQRPEPFTPRRSPVRFGVL